MSGCRLNYPFLNCSRFSKLIMGLPLSRTSMMVHPSEKMSICLSFATSLEYSLERVYSSSGCGSIVICSLRKSTRALFGSVENEAMLGTVSRMDIRLM